MGLLSVIIPVYNESRFIAQTLRRVFEVPPPKEVIVIDDGSTDNTKEIINTVAKQVNQKRPAFLKNLAVIHKAKNEGKGAAIRSALKQVNGNIVLIQDADWELDPHEYPRLLEPFEKLDADIVFGSRFKLVNNTVMPLTIHRLGNKLLTFFSNLLSGLYLTDMETCYKVFKAEIIKSFPLLSNRFGIEPELAARAARAVREKKLNFYEVPISYRPRTRAQGKKIGFRDGLVALWSIIYFNLICKN